MTITADASGTIRARFTIPQNIPAGSKEVVVTGKGGSVGHATFVGRGTIVEQELRQVTYQVIPRPVDPLAQTFALTEARQIAGLDFFVTRKGSAAAANDIRVQIRGVTVGFPNDEVFAEGVVPYNQIQMYPAATRATWVPVSLEANRSYAVVILTDDPDHAVSIAELGKFDAAKQQWVAAQPYQVGVLLSSSNAQTWTPHQDRDLKFRLLAAKYTNPVREIPLGKVAATAATDLIMLAGIDRPSTGTDVHFEMALSNGNVIRTAEQQAVALLESYSGDVNMKAVMSGNQKFSPVLYNGVQAVMGKVDTSNDYVTRAITCAGTSKVTVTFDKLAPGASAIAVKVQLDGTGAWTDVPFVSGTPVGDGYVEVKHQLAALNPSGFLRVKLVLTGSALNRPRARNLRVVVV